MSTEQDQINEYDDLVDTDPLALRDRAIALHLERDRLLRGGAELGKTVVFLGELIKDTFRLGATDPVGAMHMLGNHLAEILPDEGGLSVDEHNHIYRALTELADRQRKDIDRAAAVRRVSALLERWENPSTTQIDIRDLRAALNPAGGSEEKEDPSQPCCGLHNPIVCESDEPGMDGPCCENCPSRPRPSELTDELRDQIAEALVSHARSIKPGKISGFTERIIRANAEMRADAIAPVVKPIIEAAEQTATEAMAALASLLAEAHQPVDPPDDLDAFIAEQAADPAAAAALVSVALRKARETATEAMAEAEQLRGEVEDRKRDHAMAAEFVGKRLGFSSPMPAATAIGCVQALAAHLDDEIDRLRKGLSEARDRLASARQFRESERAYQRLIEENIRLAAERDHAASAAERARRTAQVWIDIEPQHPTATHDGHTLAWGGRQIIAALNPAGGSEEAACVRIDPEVPGELPSCATHNDVWPCTSAGQPPAPLGAHSAGGSEKGCCDECGGSGHSGDADTNGVCWDCRGTGHPHDGLCVPAGGSEEKEDPNA